MAAFARWLHDETNWALRPGPEYFARLWPAAVAIADGSPVGGVLGLPL
jgi:hypothetical protein